MIKLVLIVKLVPVDDALHKNHEMGCFSWMQHRDMLKSRNFICVGQHLLLGKFVVVQVFEEVGSMPVRSNAVQWRLVRSSDVAAKCTVSYLNGLCSRSVTSNSSLACRLTTVVAFEISGNSIWLRVRRTGCAVNAAGIS